MFFNSGYDLMQVLVKGTLAYLALIAILRVSGKRTLSKMNAFDLVVTVALGSTLATILMSKDVSLADGLLALLLLISLQYLIAWMAVRTKVVDHLIKSEPTLLLHQGKFLREKMKAERVTESEVESAIRAQGIGTIDAVAAVILETDGSFTVIGSPMQGKPTALHSVDMEKFPEGADPDY